jgi:DNA-binding MurR/RpiR family transcriptional regulator
VNPDGFLADVLDEPAGLAALPAAATLRRRGVHAVAELSSTDLPVPPGEEVVAIGICASGATEETVAALERHRGRSRTVAITHDPDGPLAALADVVVPFARSSTSRSPMPATTWSPRWSRRRWRSRRLPSGGAAAKVGRRKRP